MKILRLLVTASLFFSLFLSVEVSARDTQYVVAWDLHGVVLKKQPWGMAKRIVGLFCYAENRWQLFKYSLSPYFWHTVYHAAQNKTTDSSIIDLIAEKYPGLKEHKTEILNIANEYVLDEKVADVITYLSEKKIPQVVASNISQESFKVMQQRHSILFKNFKDFFIAGTKKKNSSEELYSSQLKPDINYYKGLRNFVDDIGLKNHTIIFIDDRNENIEGAQKAAVGIQTIRFNNEQQTKIDLENLTKKLD